MRKYIFLLLLVFMTSALWGYDTGKKPLKSTLLSLAIPGGGQFYNESYYKAAFVLALEGYFIGRTIYHHNRMNYYKDRAEGASGEEFDFYNNQYTRYYNRRQNDFWWLGSIIFLSMVDAFVDAHMFNYELEKERVHLIFERDTIRFGINF